MAQAFLYVAESIEAAALPALRDAAGETSEEEVVVLDTFGIDEARSLRDRASSKASAAAGRRFVLFARQFTHEAQNALLKLLEEPALDASFYIVVARPDRLLPTVRSRLQEVFEKPKASDALVKNDETLEVAAFFVAPYDERLAMVAKYHKIKDLAWAEAVVTAAGRRAALADPRLPATALHSLQRATQYIGTRGASAKMLLEDLALSVPIESR